MATKPYHINFIGYVWYAALFFFLKKSVILTSYTPLNTSIGCGPCLIK